VAIHKLREEVSTRRAREAALVESEDRFKKLSQASFEAMAIFDEMSLLDANEQFFEMFDYAPQDILMKPDSVTKLEAACPVIKNYLLSPDDGEPKQAEAFRKDGSTFFVEVRKRRINYQKRHATVVVCRDITLNKEAEQALKDSEELLRMLSANLLEAQDRERTRLSMELHDELAQNLASLLLRMERIRRTEPPNAGSRMEEVEKAISDINGIVEQVRRISRELSPAVLEAFGLGAAIDSLIVNFAGSKQTKFSTQIEDIDAYLSQERKVHLFRIIQECLSNIYKHSKAGNVSLQVKGTSGEVIVQIVDDGIGFEVEKSISKSLTSGGVGLTSMSERSRLLGGTLDIYSEKGKGTRLELRIPKNEGPTADLTHLRIQT